MLHVPILRRGLPYRSIDRTLLSDHLSGKPVAEVSLANMGMVRRDLQSMGNALADVPARELVAACQAAAKLFMTAELPVGESPQTFDDYIRQLSATTGMPHVLARGNAEKIRTVLDQAEQILAGLTRGLPLDVLDSGHADLNGHAVSFRRHADSLGAVLPNNSPGVHSLWIPAIPLKVPLVLKPGRLEPWTPLRIIEALSAAGVPREAFGFYPAEHAVASELLLAVDRGMLFGDTATTRLWEGDPRIELHGTGFSKVILGDDVVDDWPRYLDVLVSSVLANGGRSCVNASAVWAPRHGREIAEALAEVLARVHVLPPDDPEAKLAAFPNPAVAEAISAAIDRGLEAGGALDVTASHRATGRLVRAEHCAWLLPTIVRCDSRDHPLANREFLFPYATVVECSVAAMPRAIGPTLSLTAITQDEAFIDVLMQTPGIDRLSIGPIETWRVSWDQPHEGNLFELLYKRRAFQTEPAA